MTDTRRDRRLLLAGLSIVTLIAATVQVWADPSSARATFPGTDGRIVFSYESPVPGEGLTQTDLYSMSPDGSDLQQLTDTPHRMEFAPSWNALGTRLVFWRTRAPIGPGSIWVADADGSDPLRLTTGFDARDPVWSPDGQRIAFSMTADGSFTSDIATMRASDGGGRTRVTSWGSLEFLPAWSPDGTEIAFTRGFMRGDVGDIWVKHLATGATRQVTSGSAYDLQVGWSPDGTRLLFERAKDNLASIVRVHPDGSHRTVLTRGHFDADPAYSPSGEQIVFAGGRGTDFFPDLWLMAADGSDAHRLRQLVYASTTPDWQPIVA